MHVTTALSRMLAVPGTTATGISFTPTGIVVTLRRRTRRCSSRITLAGPRRLAQELASESPTRQRFSLVHELKHILDSPFDFTIYDGLTDRDRERISDQFAAAVLMPRRWIERAHRYPTDIRGLARTFNVSPLAMRLRLVSLNFMGVRPEDMPSRTRS